MHQLESLGDMHVLENADILGQPGSGILWCVWARAA